LALLFLPAKMLRMISRSLVLLPLGLLVAASTGCYTFRPAEVSDVVPGQDIRMRVTGAFADSLGSMLQREDARVVEGTVVSDGPRSLMLDVTVSNELEGMRLESFSQRVEVPDAAFVEVEIKELSKPRTFGALAAVAGVAAAVVISQFSGESGGAQQPGPGRPVESTISIPLSSWPLRVLGGLFGH